ncbi:hypothetical protein ACLB2K_064135 [Fragaria x ananassa]
MGMNAGRLEPAALPTFGNEPDYLALLDLKRRITEDPLRIMSSWNNSINFCSWAGVTCNDSNKRIIILNLDAQNLVGTLPPSIGNLTYVTGINLRNNSFHGELPQEMGRLINLQYLNISYNFFEGKIPANMSHCTQLRVLNIFFNQLIGPIPVELSSLVDLTVIWLGKNNLTGRIPYWIGNFSSMYGLSLGENNLQGSIPNELGRLKGLGLLILGLHGELPPNVGITLPNLETFVGALNRFTGTIPASLSNASRLQLFDFGDNGFTGKLPQNFGSLHSVVKLNFNVNRLGSGIAGDLNFLSFLANCTSLVSLGLSCNRFGGQLPASIANLSTQLKVLTLGKNLIYGSIPKGIGNLVNLTSLGLEANYFSDCVPEEIGKLWNLGALHLNHNNFSGPIPSSLELHVSGNQLSGEILKTLGNCISLERLLLEGNEFSGSIPQSMEKLRGLEVLIFHAIRITSTCMFQQQASFISRGTCPKSDNPSILCYCIHHCPFMLAAHSMRKKSGGRLLTSPSYKDSHSSISYLELVESTNGFSEQNLIGSGSFGSVYKGLLGGEGMVVAVKGNDFKSLVFKFMENGSLDSWLHPRDDDISQRKQLSLIQRLNIAIDVASAIEYLHLHCQPSIVHCDIKPSNVLLDEDMVAHVGLKGSVGYIPPEYGMGDQISILGDIYSYGILLLEMFTGKRPTDDMFKDDLSIHQFAAMALPHHVMDIADPSLLLETDDEDDDTRFANDIQERPITRYQDCPQVNTRRLEECLVSVIQIGLLCSALSPRERMLMDITANKMKAIRDSYESYLN